MTSTTDTHKEQETLADSIYEVVRQNILARRLPAGTILRESELSRFFETSREPVSRAVRLLEKDGHIRRREGQGFVVGAGTTPERAFDEADIEIPTRKASVFEGQPIWRTIYRDIEVEMLQFLPFERFKIVESAMAEHYSVSRSVIQQVIGHLCERGIAEKKSRSSCHLVMYDADFIQECYEVRMELEPAALRLAAAHLDKKAIHRCLSSHLDLTRAGPNPASVQLADLEWELHYTFLEACPNKRILKALRSSQMPLMITTGMVHTIMGTEVEQPVLTEHVSVLQLLHQGADDLAALALRAHLHASLTRSIERLPLIGQSQMPKLPRFLKPV